MMRDLEGADQGRQDAGPLGPARRDAGQELQVQPRQAADQDVDEEQQTRASSRMPMATRHGAVEERAGQPAGA